MEAPLTTELMLFGWSVLLLFVHILLQAQLATNERGITWNAGPRDGQSKPLGCHAARAERALTNFLQTYPAFVGLALALVVAGRAGGIGAAGAWIWFLARIVYVPLYLFGIPYLRSLAWAISIIGLALMLVRLL